MHIFAPFEVFLLDILSDVHRSFIHCFHLYGHDCKSANEHAPRKGTTGLTVVFLSLSLLLLKPVTGGSYSLVSYKGRGSYLFRPWKWDSRWLPVF